MNHQPTCRWERADCEHKATHHYCPHPEHACDCGGARVFQECELKLDGCEGEAEVVIAAQDPRDNIYACWSCERRYSKPSGVPAVPSADDYCENQAAHWAGACAFGRIERKHENADCHCGNCGAYRLFLAALRKAFGMGYAEAITDHARQQKEARSDA